MSRLGGRTPTRPQRTKPERRTWSSEDLTLGLAAKLFIAGTYVWTAQYLPAPIPMLLVVAAIVVVLSAGMPSVFSSASGIGIPAWIFAIILSPVRGDDGIPIRPALVLFIVALLCIRQTNIVLSTRTAGRPKILAADALRAMGVLALVGLLVVPVVAMFGSPASQGGSIFGGEGDGAQPYWGFSDRMDTANRGDLGDEVVMRVHATAPSFWRGQTFDQWDGRAWTRSERSDVVARSLSADETGVTSIGATGIEAGETLTQTFTLERDGSDVVFGAPDIVSIDHPVNRFSQFGDDSIRAPIDLAAGSQYTVISERPFVTAGLLQEADPLVRTVPDDIADQYLDVQVTDKVRALAEQITAGAPTAYDKIRALEAWMGNNIVYDTNIPTLPAGADAVEHLLFVDKVGFCEQIGSALAVMARSIGIPARLAVGYVPNDFDRLRGSWTVRARDAHSWTEIYFPGVGWQGFDPTAEVPLSGPRPEPTAAGNSVVSAGAVVAALVLAVVLVALASLVLHAVRLRSRTWQTRIGDRVEQLGKDAGRPRKPGESLGRYAETLGKMSGRTELVELGTIFHRVQFSPEGENREDQARSEELLTALEDPKQRPVRQVPLPVD